MRNPCWLCGIDLVEITIIGNIFLSEGIAMLIDIMTSAFMPSKLSCVYLVKISEIRKKFLTMKYPLIDDLQMNYFFPCMDFAYFLQKSFSRLISFPHIPVPLQVIHSGLSSNLSLDIVFCSQSIYSTTCFVILGLDSLSAS